MVPVNLHVFAGHGSACCCSAESQSDWNASRRRLSISSSMAWHRTLDAKQRMCVKLSVWHSKFGQEFLALRAWLEVLPEKPNDAAHVDAHTL